MGRIVLEGVPYHIDHADAYVGKVIGESEWYPVTQEQVSRFGEATDDFNPIHVDPQWSAEHSPFGGPVAHGFYTLSLLSHLSWAIGLQPDGVDYGLNLGFERVRFLAPVMIGDCLRMRAHLQEVVRRGDDKWQFRTRVVLETQATQKAALNATWLTLFIRDPDGAPALAYKGEKPGKRSP
jgi:acyl dehydratase